MRCNIPIMKAKPNRDDVERLSRGQPTRAKIGSRRIGHRLTIKERQLFEAAQRQGYLKIPVTGIRPNVLNVYRQSFSIDHVNLGSPVRRVGDRSHFWAF